MLSRLEYGDLSKYGICRPQRGPFAHKIATGRSPVIDVGTLGKILFFFYFFLDIIEILI